MVTDSDKYEGLWSSGDLSNKAVGEAQGMIIFIYVCCKDIGQDTMESNKAVMGTQGVTTN